MRFNLISERDATLNCKTPLKGELAHFLRNQRTRRINLRQPKKRAHCLRRSPLPSRLVSGVRCAALSPVTVPAPMGMNPLLRNLQLVQGVNVSPRGREQGIVVRARP